VKYFKFSHQCLGDWQLQNYNKSVNIFNVLHVCANFGDKMHVIDVLCYRS